MTIEISIYNRQRNEMLMQRDPELLIAFMKKHKLKIPTSYAAAEVTLHKTITAINSLPMEMRTQSKRWLLDRGFMPLDDGNVPT